LSARVSRVWPDGASPRYQAVAADFIVCLATPGQPDDRARERRGVEWLRHTCSEPSLQAESAILFTRESCQGDHISRATNGLQQNIQFDKK
jgi:hypothetical protein